MPFKTPLRIEEHDPDAGLWRLMSPLIYEGCRECFIVEKGFVTDLASTPRLTWVLVPPFGIYQKAAVIHDWLCVKRIISWQDTHAVFFRIMKELCTPYWKARPMYAAVHHFGPRWPESGTAIGYAA